MFVLVAKMVFFKKNYFFIFLNRFNMLILKENIILIYFQIK
jgi:hypothetical protein